MYIYIYIYTHTHIYIYIYIYIVLCFVINYEKISHNYFKNGYKINAIGIVQILDLEEMRAQQHEEWILSEKCHRYINIFMIWIKNIDTPCRFLVKNYTDVN